MHIALSDTRTIVLHNPKNTARRKHMLAVMKGIGMKRYELFEALHEEGYILSATKSLMAIFERELLCDPFEPFLLLEDDVMVAPWVETLDLEIPQDADAVYVGISTCSAHPAKETHRVGIPWTEMALPHLVKIENMLSQHAVLICSKRWLTMLMRSMMVGAVLNMSWDIPTARLMHRYNVYAPRKPIFYQDARVGGQQDPTLTTFESIEWVPFQHSDPTTCIRFEPPAAMIGKSI